MRAVRIEDLTLVISFSDLEIKSFHVYIYSPLVCHSQIQFIGVYILRHHHKNDVTSIEILHDTLKKVNKRNREVIVCGDLNYYLIHEKNEIIKSFPNTLARMYSEP